MSKELAQRNKLMGALELDEIKQQLSSLLDANPKKMEAFKARILKISLNPMLSGCSSESIISCGLQALTLDLPLEAGQGYIVNYGGSAQFDCGYKGWQVLAKRAGFSVTADVVYSCDEFYQEGYGFNKEMKFTPDFENRKGSDDQWAKANLYGVIVSVMQDETKTVTTAFIDAAMIHKIVGNSPSVKTEAGRRHSPHEKWAEQMFCAKAIKQFLSKFPIDIGAASQLNEAINIASSTEIKAQEKNDSYPQDRFESIFPKWVEAVQAGKKSSQAIIAQFAAAQKPTQRQMLEILKLRNYEPIDVSAET